MYVRINDTSVGAVQYSHPPSSPGLSIVEEEEDCAAGSDSDDFKLLPSPSNSEDESETDSCGKRRVMGMGA